MSSNACLPRPGRERCQRRRQQQPENAIDPPGANTSVVFCARVFLPLLRQVRPVAMHLSALPPRSTRQGQAAHAVACGHPCLGPVALRHNGPCMAPDSFLASPVRAARAGLVGLRRPGVRRLGGRFRVAHSAGRSRLAPPVLARPQVLASRSRRCGIGGPGAGRRQHRRQASSWSPPSGKSAGRSIRCPKCARSSPAKSREQCAVPQSPRPGHVTGLLANDHIETPARRRCAGCFDDTRTIQSAAAIAGTASARVSIQESLSVLAASGFELSARGAPLAALVPPLDSPSSGFPPAKESPELGIRRSTGAAIRHGPRLTLQARAFLYFTPQHVTHGDYVHFGCRASAPATARNLE